MTITSIDNAIVAFIDILGFRNLVRSLGDRLAIARRLDTAMERALEAFGGKESLRGTPDAEWRVRVFSDCICVSKPLTDIGVVITLEAICLFSQEMFAEGFPVRGGVTIGPYIESELIIFSEAQIIAYDIESQIAQFPRVVLSTEFINYVDSLDDDEVRQSAKEYIIIDGDDLSFVNYLLFYEEDSWFGGAGFYHIMNKNISEALFLSINTPAVREKYEWMAMFHNWSLRHTAEILKKSGTLCEDTVWDFGSLIIDNIGKRRQFVTYLWTDRSFSPPKSKMTEESINWIKHWPGQSTEDDEDEPDCEDEDV